MSDAGIDQKEFSVEEKFSTPRVVKNARTGQVYTVGIGLPKDSFFREFNLFYPPTQPHFFQADNFQLIKSRGTQRDEILLDKNRVNVLYMHGVFKDGQWWPEDNSLQQKGITIEDIVRDHEAGGSLVDVLFVCSNINNSRVKALPFQGKFDRPKVYMKNKPAEGSVMIDPKTGEVRVQMKVESSGDVEFEKWKNWGKVKLI